jgi:glycosyltransferase involved in cell wall biosynthesis
VAQIPVLVFGPSTLLGIIALITGGGPTSPTPAEDWRDATVDIVIQSLNEEDNIVRCLASVMRQTLRPRKIVVVDDGSSDTTAARAAAFSDFHRLDVLVIKRVNSIGKTASIRTQACMLDSNVLFVLDADTVLESERYLERTVQELCQDPGIASAEGSILPLRERDRRAWDNSPEVRAFVDAFASYRPALRRTWRRRLDVFHRFLRRIDFRDQKRTETVSTTPGCAVAYRRVSLEALFDVPVLGNDLTNSEDIFVGLTIVDEGYRNIQVTDVCARTHQP